MDTPERLKRMLSGPNAELALFERLRELDRIARFSYAEIGLICLQVQAKGIWQQRCHSFNAWVHEACPWGHATAYKAMSDVESLHDMPVEEVSRILGANFSVMRKLSTAVRNDPQVIKAAQTQTREELVTHIQQHHPQQHIELSMIKRVVMSESLKVVYDRVILQAKIRGATNETEALEMALVECEESWKAEDAVMEAAVRAEGKEWVQ